MSRSLDLEIAEMVWSHQLSPRLLPTHSPLRLLTIIHAVCEYAFVPRLGLVVQSVSFPACTFNIHFKVSSQSLELLSPFDCTSHFPLIAADP